MAYEWIIENKEILKIIYALFISFICSVIVLKSDRLFKISDYQGLRYFRNSFFFFGIAFIFRYILGGMSRANLPDNYFILMNFLFEFSIIVGSLLLFYSLIWRKLEKEKSHHSFFNRNMGILYLIAVGIVLFDFLYSGSPFMYVFEIILFLGMSFIGYKKTCRGNMNKTYFITLLIGLIIWLLNAGLYFFLNWNELIKIIVYILNIIFFSLFFYTVIKMTKEKNG